MFSPPHVDPRAHCQSQVHVHKTVCVCEPQKRKKKIVTAAQIFGKRVLLHARFSRLSVRPACFIVRGHVGYRNGEKKFS